MSSSNLIYLDNNATTPIDERVLDAMLPYFKNQFGNASSTHAFGLAIKKQVNEAKTKVAELINAEAKEITFTSGATESINLILKGIALHPSNSKKHIVTVQTEHKAVLDTCKFLETVGFDIDYLPVDREGLLSLEQLQKSIRTDTLLVCVMWVNNETGVIQPIKEIGVIVKNGGAFFVTDATQAAGKLPIDVFDYPIDGMCFSAHKMYGPKGIGALYVNNETLRSNNIAPLIHGGGHENGLRSGTLNVPAIIGFGKAAEIALNEMKSNTESISKMRDELENELLKIRGAFVNGSKNKRLFNTLNICMPNLDANVFIGQHPQFAISNGSACTAALVEASHVLKAMGLNDNEALGSLRISIGKYNSNQELTILIEGINSAINIL